jgi:two-component system response regulator MprA
VDQARVLLVDDDVSVLDGLARALARQHYDVIRAVDGESCLRLADADEPDLIVLDVVLPGMDGLAVCQELRMRGATPILMLTTRGTIIDKVTGLERGADDYMAKPFSVEEFVARVRAMLRRTPPAQSDVLTYADVSVDVRGRRASRGGETLGLTYRELELLLVFLRHPDEALTRDHLSRSVWGHSHDGSSNFVDATVTRLRQKLEGSGQSRLIHPIRGFGYVLRQE